ncbi:hypothetical protein EIN_226220 [Entamoeba invadens IP1]|uniref:Pre-mRNA-splicing factor SYF2 n=1 Tax=Entamoeba invadens IP1 TaxID=370355 RepID=A0A0A1U2J9_ENTIV|nr:hypothetical protein EIN_226220 [Entamoeba invadens IP1]ELP88259.1 hypothetical protein EIN_226220 [Entamoeba invadens IP1]|eukprot:XP_004255030.1 hypothetical protein EIN_226220 [Entamoeba invadens IP1]
MSKHLSFEELVEMEEKAAQRKEEKKTKPIQKQDTWLDEPANKNVKKKTTQRYEGDITGQAYHAYEKKISWLDEEKTREGYDAYKNDTSLQAKVGEGYVSDEKLELLKKQMKKGSEDAQKFHRKRKEKIVRCDFINDKNKKFNEAASKAFDKYTEDIRDALEHP